MTNKEAYKKVSEKVIALLAEADTLMMNSTGDFNSSTDDAVELEYFIQAQMFHGAVRAALSAYSDTTQELDASGEETGVSIITPLQFD